MLLRFRRGEPAMLEPDARSLAAGLEGDEELRRSGRHRVVARLAPGDLDEQWTFEAREVPADEDAVDVDGEEAAVHRLEPRDISHPADEELGPHEIIEDALWRRRDVDRGEEGVAHRPFSMSSLSASRRGAQKLRTNSSTG